MLLLLSMYDWLMLFPMSRQTSHLLPIMSISVWEMLFPMLDFRSSSYNLIKHSFPILLYFFFGIGEQVVAQKVTFGGSLHHVDCVIILCTCSETISNWHFILLIF